MKRIRVVAAVIRSEDKILPQREDTVNLRANGSFLEERSNLRKHHKKP